MRRIVAIAIVMSARVAWAHTPPPEPEPPSVERPMIEWSSWFQLAYGYESVAPAITPLAAGTTTPPGASDRWSWGAALGADLTLGLGARGDVRIGPWLELRGVHPVAGAEIAITGVPRSLDLFFFDGQGILIARAGAGERVVTGALAYGYLAPWRLFGPRPGRSRYMIGVRVVATATRAIDDPRDGSITMGLEAEPVGAIRYLLGIKSWY